MLGNFTEAVGELRGVVVLSVDTVGQSFVEVENQRLGLPWLLGRRQSDEVQLVEGLFAQLLGKLVQV